MTSTASQQNQISAPNSTAALSYASAAGASRRPGGVIAGGINPPVVVGSSAPAPHNGRPSSISPVNGRPNITPAIPVTAVPTIVHSSLNGAANEHARKSSVTISANAPSSHIANGGPVGGAKAIPQFGFKDSPAIAHSTPQISASAPIPIPGNHRIPSPAHSPSPIPQPSASGGRPPHSAPPPNQMMFGSFPGDGDRHMNKATLPQNPHAMGPQQTGAHLRRDSQVSSHGEMASHGGPGPNRGGYQGHQGHQGHQGRGGRNFTPSYNNHQSLGYPPHQRYGPNPGRGGMSSYQGGRGGMPPFPNSPQPPRASPAQVPAIPHPGTPNMSQAVPIPPQQYYSPQHMYSQMGQMGMPYPALDNYGRPMMGGFAGYSNQQMPQYMNPPPPASSSGFSQQYVGGPYGQGPPAAQPMSRNSSQISEQRPASRAGQNQPPMIVQGTPQPRPSQATPPAIVSSTPPVQRQPRKSAAITIKNDKGEVLDLHTFNKAPVSPVPSIQQSKTPPVVASAPTPPPKSATPSHARSESASASKTAKQIQNEFKDQVRKTAEGPTPEEEAAAAAAEKAAADEQAREEQAREEQARVEQAKEAAAKEEAAKEEARRKEEERAAAEKKKNEEEAKARDQAEAEAKAKAESEAKAKAEAESEAKAKAEAESEAKAKAEAEAKEKAKAEAAAVAAAVAAAAAAKKEEPKSDIPKDEEDELERIIREMEEADARREQEQAALSAKKNAERAEAKKRAAQENALSSAEKDRKLREQEREMERLEEEREKQRHDREEKATSAGNAKSVADLLAEKIEDLKLSDKKDSATTPSTVAEKLANLNINTGDNGLTTPAPRTGGSDKTVRAKPAALNLVVPSKPVEAPQPSAALQSLRSARFLGKNELADLKMYPPGISSPNPALNPAAIRKNRTFKYDAHFLLQFQKVFTEQPSMEFHQQVKSLIGDTESGSRSASTRSAGVEPRRQGSKAGTVGPFPIQSNTIMGSFTRTLPPGTTSAERLAMSQGNVPRPAMGNSMASVGRPGSFAGPHQMSRTPSSNIGGIPNSPRQGSRRGGGSKRNDYSVAKEVQAAKIMPLTEGLQVKPIAVSATGWKPTSVVSKAAVSGQSAAGMPQAGHLDPEMVQRKVKAALNKMTPEKFDKISDQILAIAAQSKNEQDGRTLRQVIQLTFEKATDEAHWASMYAKFCKRMHDVMSSEIRDESITDKAGNVVSGGALFRKYLLNRCQEEFERGWKIDLPEKEEGKPGEVVLLSDEYYQAAAAKRRGLGLVQFIGELYKLSMLTERIMHECVRKLLDIQGVPDEAEIESLTKLLRTIGANIDNHEKGHAAMDVYFQRIHSIIELPDLPSRLKFMLMDIVDLRRARWASKEANKGPKTLEEVRAEVEAQVAQKAAENARNNQRGPTGGRPQVGRGDARNFSAYAQPVLNQVGMDDLRKLGKVSSTRASSANLPFGPTSMFNSRSNSGRRLAPGGPFGRAGEESGASSRTGTPPTRERDSVAHANTFGLLADTGDHPASPPSTAASPALSKAALDTSASGDKRDG